MKTVVITFLSVFFMIQSFALAQDAKAIFAAGCFWCIEKDFEHF